MPTEFSLDSNYPNPFNANTTIEFFVPMLSNIKIEIFDIRGRLQMTAFNSILKAGQHYVNIDASSLSSGVYLYRMNAADIDGREQFSNTQKMMLVK